MAATRLRGREREPRPTESRDDPYLYMLIISLVATIIGCVFLFLDWDSWKGKPNVPEVKAVTRSADGSLPGGGQQPSTPAPGPGG